MVTTVDSTFYRALESAVKRRHPDAIVTPMTCRTARTRTASPTRRKELRLHARRRAGCVDHVDARRRRVPAGRCRRAGDPDPLRGHQGHCFEIGSTGFSTLWRTVLSGRTAAHYVYSGRRRAPQDLVIAAGRIAPADHAHGGHGRLPGGPNVCYRLLTLRPGGTATGRRGA